MMEGMLSRARSHDPEFLRLGTSRRGCLIRSIRAEPVRSVETTADNCVHRSLTSTLNGAFQNPASDCHAFTVFVLFLRPSKQWMAWTACSWDLLTLLSLDLTAVSHYTPTWGRSTVWWVSCRSW